MTGSIVEQVVEFARPRQELTVTENSRGTTRPSMDLDLPIRDENITPEWLLWADSVENLLVAGVLML